MKWISNFYQKQYEWWNTLTSKNTEELQDELVEKMEQFMDQPSKKILELGGGNGQFAVTAAKHGYDVTVIELISECVEHTTKLAKKHHVESNLRAIQGDFFEVELKEKFDVICYWDGFGVGTDGDQKVLLQRISEEWLKPNGTTLIDIYTPWYWAKTAGEEMTIEGISRKYDFDAIECRMLDTWWKTDEPTTKVSQSLRCYSPADLNLLINELPLQLQHCEPSGAMDYEKWKYQTKVPLGQAMSYMAKLKLD
ncbi:Methyltransferase domain-containing protein [Oceanobacillus limi]|uniref:Methyltransferase domain-containing protein n=1 Tax=Oceanobacillus limi TaxID=930131 RepID=A0A1I0CE25_9BACI|nr:class I SAM-dependent methyltransferase [Oceanobacillus limi]SET17828.1 Methyltransferase domain-containing protein [Oceanobacillus limi]